MSRDYLVSKATIDPITTRVDYQGNPREPSTKSWCLDSLKFVEYQPNDSKFWNITELLYKLNENENRE